MKRILLVIFALISLNAFSQLQVKEGSFRYVPGGVIDDKAEYTDGNDLPMALIKISTENISEQERMRLVFVGNRATQIIKKPKTGSMWIYISAELATFIDIRHPDYGTYKYYLPEELCDYCVYEMVLRYVPLVASANESVKPQNNFLTITCDQDNAAVYIDDEYVGDKDGFKSLPIGSTHTWRIECDLYHTESGSVTITEGQLIIDKTLRPAFGFLNVKSTPENGAIVYVNNKRVGETPYTSERLASGSYKVRVVKEMYKTSEQTFVVSDGKTTNAVLNMIANFVNVTINTDSQSDIYVDEELKGKGKWSGRLSEGAHLVEARKISHTSTFKEVNLTAGMTEVINVESPKPIYGYLEISSVPILADIYIDGKHSGQTPKVIYDLLIGEHELKLSKQGYAELKKTIVIKEGETLVLNEKLQTGKEITITTDEVKKLKLSDIESYRNELQKKMGNKMCDYMSVQLCGSLGMHKNWMIESVWGVSLDGMYELDVIDGVLGGFIYGMVGKKNVIEDMRSFSLMSGLTIGFITYWGETHCLRLGMGYGRRGYEYSKFDFSSLEDNDFYGIIQGREFLVGYFVFSENILSGSVDIVFSPNMIEFRVGFGYPWRWGKK